MFKKMFVVAPATVVAFGSLSGVSANAAVPAAAGSDWVLPVAGAVLEDAKEQGFSKWLGRCHVGQDFAGTNTTPVVAPAAGRVVSAGGTYGSVVIQHSPKTKSVFMHMVKINTSLKGKWIKKGQTIGYVGGQGYTGPNTYSPHLHFEVIHGGKAMYLTPWFKGVASPVNCKKNIPT